MKNEAKEFHMKCGEIIRMALHVESNLDVFISDYFCSPQSYKTLLLSDSMLIHLRFARKIDIFKEICKREGINGNRAQGITESMNFVRETRNQVAHHEAFVSEPEEGIKLRPRKSVMYKGDELKLTDELIKKVDEKRLSAIQGITKIHLEFDEKFQQRD